MHWDPGMGVRPEPQTNVFCPKLFQSGFLAQAVFHAPRATLAPCSTARARAAVRETRMAGRARAAAISPGRVAACPASLLGVVLLPAASGASRGAETAVAVVVGCGSRAAMGGARLVATIAVAVAVPQWSRA